MFKLINLKLLGIGFALVLACNVVVAAKFYVLGKKRAEAEHLQQSMQTANKKLTIKEEQDEIRNNKPDSSGVAKRLRAGTF